MHRSREKDTKEFETEASDEMKILFRVPFFTATTSRRKTFRRVAIGVHNNVFSTGPCTVKHCGLVIYGKRTDFVVS
jgi:hypothetical protein